MGLTQGLYVPIAASLIIDYFPLSKRTSAFAVISIGQSIGIALVSVSTNLITMSGWRRTFWEVGGVFAGLGILILISVREPIRGYFTYKISNTNNQTVREFPLWTLFKQFWQIL